MASRNSKSGFSRGWAAFFAVVIILGGVAVSLGVGVRLRSALERNAQARVETASRLLQTTVDEQLARYVDTVRVVAAAMNTLGTPDADSFSDITAAVAEQKLTAASAIRFVAPATPEEVDGVDAYWRARGAKKLTVVPLKGAQQHLFTIFGRGLNGDTAPPAGIDQAAAVAMIEVTRIARSSDGVAVSDAYVLLSDVKKPDDEQQLSFDVVAPVSAGDGKVAGFVVLSIGGTDFVSTLLTRAAGDLLDASLMTRSATGELAEVATVQRPGRSADFRYAVDFVSGQRQWVLRTGADQDVLLPATGRTDMVIVLAGSVLAVMFGTLLYLLISAPQRLEREIEAEVAERMEAAGLAPSAPESSELEESVSPS